MSVQPDNLPQTRHTPLCTLRHGSLGAPLAQTSGDNLPLWQTERAQILQKACERIKARMARGQGVLHTVRIVAQSLNGQPFKCDPARRLRLTPKTLLRLFYWWRSSAENSAVFRLHFTCRHSLFENLIIA